MAQETDSTAPSTSRTNGSGWCSWTRTSAMMLRTVEKKILSCLKTPYRGSFVDIGPVVGDNGDKIWTIAMNEGSTAKAPLVMLHGLGAGAALWCLNLDSLAANRTVYAVDLLGFGRSSRPSFSSDAIKAEEQFVKSLEEWRREMNLDSFILLGHSLGGFLAASYSLKYPQRVRHLILADPWGFVERPDNWQEKYKAPVWVRAIFVAVRPLNPLWALRAVGPAGPWLIEKMRPDIIRKFSAHLAGMPEVEKLIPMYIHQCNAQTPSGESAFHAMMSNFGWAQNSMAPRLPNMDPEISVTLISGSRSWIEIPPDVMRTAGSGATNGAIVDGQNGLSPQKACRTETKVISGAGHHVYLDKPETFNKYVNEACELADSLVTDNIKERNTINSNSDPESSQNS